MKQRCYIAGPTTGLPGWNFPAFHAAAKRWRDRGWEVINPAETFDGVTDLSYRAYVEKDLADLKRCDAIVMLQGWDNPGSRGAVWEREIARSLLGIPVYGEFQEVWTDQCDTPIIPKAENLTVLSEADMLVNGARQADYGHPIEDFTRTGRIWGAILGTPDVPPDKVALCMVGVKISREVNKPKRNNRVDMAGYTATLDMVRERQGSA